MVRQSMAVLQEVLKDLAVELTDYRDDILHLAYAEANGQTDEVRTSVAVLAEICVFHPDHCLQIHRAIWELAQKFGIFPASIEHLYRMAAQGELVGHTVPAVNMRALAFHSARGVFRAMKTKQAGAVIFELSRGEIGFTGQRPHEYAVMILSAAIAEGHVGPVFLQGDHFQVSARKFNEEPTVEMQAVKDLIAEAVSAGFYNIDIDTSTLVDLSHFTETEQQRVNFECTAELLHHTRGLEPEGVTISIGGEIGEVGDHNSTTNEVDAYLDGVKSLLNDLVGPSKLSIQSGTKHGGNILSDGSIGDMPIDFALIRALTERCRNPHGLGGCVQHGASMLSLEKMSKLPEAGCLEVHLAAAFLNAVYDVLPEELVAKSDSWAIETFSDEWKSDCSRAQFLHHARRYPIVEFRHMWWSAKDCHAMICARVEQVASAYIHALAVANTIELVVTDVGHDPTPWVTPVNVRTDTSAEAALRELAG